MPTAVVLLLTDDGQMLVGEVDPGMVPQEELQPVESFDEGAQAAEQLLLGESLPEVGEEAFNGALKAPMRNEMDGGY